MKLLSQGGLIYEAGIELILRVSISEAPVRGVLT